MARMNWGRVRSETSMARYGWKRAEETYHSTKKKNKKRKRKRKSPLKRTDLPANEPTNARAVIEKRQLAHEALVRKQQEKAAKRKEAKRLKHEAMIEAARQAKAARLADPAYQARKAANRLASRERRKARRRHKVSLESVTVVRRKGGREVVVRTGMTGSTSTGDGDKSV
jgi:hypothetical protein